MGGDSDEGLGENLFDARTGSYDELYIGSTSGGGVYTSQFGLGPNVLHEEAGMIDSECAAPDLSCNNSFCGDSDVLAERADGQDCVGRPKLAQSERGEEVQSPGCDSDSAPDRGLGGGALGEGWWVGTGGNDQQAQKRCRKNPTTSVTAADVLAASFGGRGSGTVVAAGQCRTCSLCGRSGHNRRTCPQARLSSSLTDSLKPDIPNVMNQAQGVQWVLRGENQGEGSTPLWAGTLVEALYDNGLWYEGVIESHDSTTGRYKITFPDGECVTTPLPDDNFRILSSTRAVGPIRSGVSIACTVENGGNGCAPAPVCSGNNHMLVAASAGGGGCYVARPLDYAQACMLPRPNSWYAILSFALVHTCVTKFPLISISNQLIQFCSPAS
jgi:hypothetical protein